MANYWTPDDMREQLVLQSLQRGMDHALAAATTEEMFRRWCRAWASHWCDTMFAGGPRDPGDEQEAQR